MTWLTSELIKYINLLNDLIYLILVQYPCKVPLAVKENERKMTVLYCSFAAYDRRILHFTHAHPQLKPHFLLLVVDIWIFPWTRDKSSLRWLHMCEPLGKFRFISMRMQIHFGPPLPQNFWHISLGRKTNAFLMSINYAFPVIDDHILFEQTEQSETLPQSKHKHEVWMVLLLWYENIFMHFISANRSSLHFSPFADSFYEADP